MNTKVERIENNTVKLEITVGAEKFSEALKKSYSKNVKKFNIPGFRKGKAPMYIIKKHYGEEVFYEDAVNICCEDTYPEVIKENNINPVDYPEIDIVQIGENKEFIYTAIVTVKPEVELGQYNGVEVKEVVYEVSDEDVEKQLKTMQEKNSRIEVKENGTVENGNIAIIDFKGFIDGVPFEGGEGNDYSLEIGSKSFIDTFEEQLIGLGKGESKVVNVTFPQEYGNESLNGKPAIFEVTVKEIKVKECPALDDEFAKEASEFDSLEELKNDIRKKSEEANNLKIAAEYQDRVLSTVCDNAKIEIPEAMIRKEVDVMIKDLEYRLQYQGMDLKTYYQYTNSSEETVRGYMKDSAEKRVRMDLVLEKIAEVENVTASDEELAEKAAEMAKQYGEKDIEKTVSLILKGQKEYLKSDIIREKVVNMLVNNSKKTA